VLRFSLKIVVQSSEFTDQSESEEGLEVSCRNIKKARDAGTLKDTSTIL
jgi:hypothetical protein